MLDQLQKRGWLLVNRYFICDVKKESVDHILLLCPKVRVLSNCFLHYVVFNGCKLLPLKRLLGWYDSFMSKRRKKV